MAILSRTTEQQFLGVRLVTGIHIDVESDSTDLIGEISELGVPRPRNGRAIRFKADDVRVFKGRDSTGVRGVRLQDGDEVISMAILGRVDATPEERAAYVKHANAMRKALVGAEAEEDAAAPVEAEDDVADAALTVERIAELGAAEQFILTVTETGFGKRSSAYEYRRTGRGGDDHGRRPGRDETGHRRLDGRQGVDAWVVQDDGDELADRGQAVLRERVRLGLRVVRQEAVGAELGRRDAELTHLRQHGLRLVLPPPADDLAHPPRDGGGGDPLGERGAHGRVGHGHSPRISVRATARRWARESSQASATRKASSESAMVHGLSRRPAATSQKAVSSAR